MMNHRPTHLAPPGRQILVHHDHVDRPADTADSVAEANSLSDTVLDIALYDQEVQIAVARELSARSRPKQDHACRRRGSLHEPLAGQLDQLLCSHEEKPISRRGEQGRLPKSSDGCHALE